MAAAFLICLGILEYLVFSESFSQFFQGDALFYMSHRFRSLSEFFRALYTLDIAHWYRPLASQTIPSLFFPWFGLNPYGYHWIVFFVFFAVTCVLFIFLRRLTSSFVAAAAGTAFFAIHSINVYVTYDFAFAPELFYACFYLLACIAYLLGRESKRWYVLAIVFFVFALMSKEAAVTLPANILLLSFLFSADRDRRDVLPFFGIFLLYYVYIVRVLKVGAGDYALALHKDVFTRLQNSFLWAFDLTRERMMLGAILAAVVVIVYAIASFLGSRRRYALFGICWFLIALSPMLGIVGYFGPYYLFLPLAGIALIVGDFFDWLYRRISRLNSKAAFISVFLGLLPFMFAARTNAQAELYTNHALGYAGRIAGNSARDLKRWHDRVPRGATVYILNPDQPDLWRFLGINGLLRLLYSDDTIDVRYSSLGHTSSDVADSGKLIVMKYANEGLVPVEANQIPAAKSEDDFQYETSSKFTFDVSPNQVVAGKDSYTVQISGAENREVELQYRFNEGPLVFFTIHLNTRGETRFFVSDETKRGIYRFVGMRILPTQTWTRVTGAVTVVD